MAPFNFIKKLFSNTSDSASGKATGGFSEVKIFAPISGKLVSLDKVPDPVFSEKMMGDGVAIEPTGDVVCTPVDGVLMQIFDTNHAFTMKTKDGIDILVHIGIDTVAMKGKGFTRLFNGSFGSEVKVGEPVLKLDLSLISSKAKSTVTPVIIANMDEFSDKFKSLTPASNTDVEAGTSAILSIKLDN